MLKVRSRRTCIHGGGIPAKASVKGRGLKKIVLSALVHQDGRLISSSPRKLKAGIAVDTATGVEPLKQLDLSGSLLKPCSLSADNPLESVREDRLPEGTTDMKENNETDTIIFSPTFHPLRKPSCDSHDSGSNAIEQITENTTSGRLVEEGESLASLQRVDNTSLLSSPKGVDDGIVDVALEGETVADDGDDLEFDPFLFIKRLPKLSDVVPPFRPQLLPKQTRRCPPVSLVLDLDETLVHSTLDNCYESDFTFPVDFNNSLHTVHVRMRPHLNEFLDKASQLFEVIVFTASQGVYADKLLNILDPRRQWVQHRIFRDSCVFVEGNYLKDLSILGRDLSKVAIIDNSPQAFGFQIANGIPIESWFEDRNDRALLELLPFLHSLAHVDDVRPLIAARFNLQKKVEMAVERRRAW